MRIELSLAWRYLHGRRLRTALTTLAVAFGVFVFFAMRIILPTVSKALFIGAQAAEGMADFTVQGASGGAIGLRSLDAIRSIEGVRAATPLLSRTLGLPADFLDRDPARADPVRAVTVTGVDPATVRALRAFPLEAGRFLETGDAAGALVTQTFADAAGLEPGNSFSLPSPGGTIDLFVVGVTPPALGSAAEEIVVGLASARALTGIPEGATAILVGLDDPGVKREIRTAVREKIEAQIGPGERVMDALAEPEAFATLELASTVMNAFGVLALFMGGFIIFNTFRAVVAERRRDLGMLRALGASRGAVTRVILAEGFIQGVAGSVLGMLLGYGVVSLALAAVGPVMSRFIALDLGAPAVTPSSVLASLAMGVGASIVAALLPAVSASRVTPMEALRPPAAEPSFIRKAVASIIAGAAIAAGAAVLSALTPPTLAPAWGFLFLAALAIASPGLIGPFARLAGHVSSLARRRGGTGSVARGNLVRQPSRAAATASSTMIGLAVIVAAGGMLASLVMPLRDLFLKNLGSDYLLLPPSVMLWNSNIGADPSLVRSIREVEGVQEVSAQGYAPSSSGKDSGPLSMIGIDTEAFPRVSGLRFMEGGEAAYGELARGRSLIANGVFLMATGAKPGGTVRLATLAGETDYRVAAVATDMLNMKAPAAFVSRENLERDFGGREDVLIQIDLARGADEAKADAAIKEIAKAYPQFMLVRGKAYLDSIMGLMGAAFSGIFVLFGILALPSLIATINTLCIGVIERTREIGMVRAVGASRPQVRNMVLAEALLLAGIGTALGIGGGIGLSSAFVSSLGAMFPFGFSFPLAGIAAAVLFGLGFGALASVIPARQAASLEIVEALRYE